MNWALVLSLTHHRRDVWATELGFSIGEDRKT
mgnify:CR=1 FL=1